MEYVLTIIFIAVGLNSFRYWRRFQIKFGLYADDLAEPLNKEQLEEKRVLKAAYFKSFIYGMIGFIACFILFGLWKNDLLF